MGVPISVLDRSKNARPVSVQRKTYQNPYKHLEFQEISSPTPHTHTDSPYQLSSTMWLCITHLGWGKRQGGRGFGLTTDIATCACKRRCQKEKANNYVTIFFYLINKVSKLWFLKIIFKHVPHQCPRSPQFVTFILLLPWSICPHSPVPQNS